MSDRVDDYLEIVSREKNGGVVLEVAQGEQATDIFVSVVKKLRWLWFGETNLNAIPKDVKTKIPEEVRLYTLDMAGKEFKEFMYEYLLANGLAEANVANVRIEDWTAIIQMNPAHLPVVVRRGLSSENLEVVITFKINLLYQDEETHDSSDVDWCIKTITTISASKELKLLLRPALSFLLTKDFPYLALNETSAGFPITIPIDQVGKMHERLQEFINTIPEDKKMNF